MSQSPESRAQSSRRTFEKPPIGVVATGDNDEEIARVYLRARANGHEVLITHEQGVDFGLTELGEVSDARFIPLAETEEGFEEPNKVLRAAARTISAPGLMIVEDTSEPVDFRRSLERFDHEEFVCKTIPEPAVGVDTLIGIPAYNEANTIGTVVEEASEYADDVLVIDDGSADETASAAENAGATVISHNRNKGYGAALKTAFDTADSWDVECLVIVDGDNQHDVDDIPKLCSPIRNGEANVAIGSRFAGKGKQEIPLYRRFGLGVINVMSNVSMGAVWPQSWVSDTQSGFRAYDAHAIEELSNAGIGNGMDASLDILYQVRDDGLEVAEVATVVDYSVENSHSQNPVSHGLRLVGNILRTVEHDHPVKFIGVPGFAGALLGLGFAYFTISNFIQSGVFPLGTALVSVFFVLLGILACFTAIILHSLNQLHE